MMLMLSLLTSTNRSAATRYMRRCRPLSFPIRHRPPPTTSSASEFARRPPVFTSVLSDIFHASAEGHAFSEGETAGGRLIPAPMAPTPSSARRRATQQPRRRGSARATPCTVNSSAHKVASLLFSRQYSAAQAHAGVRQRKVRACAARMLRHAVMRTVTPRLLLQNEWRSSAVEDIAPRLSAPVRPCFVTSDYYAGSCRHYHPESRLLLFSSSGQQCFLPACPHIPPRFLFILLLLLQIR